MKKRAASANLAFTSSLSLVASNYAFRCDAKFADESVRDLLERVVTGGHFQLGRFLPLPFVKGIQPNYLDEETEDSARVISTLAIQNLSINERNCRFITSDDFEALSPERQLRKGDVLLTVDGGVSIGKPCLFNLKGKFTVDSHVVVLRPRGISPLALVYLLASPLGQMQFRRAESGASGQTNVTEDDVRRFIFPSAALTSIDATAKVIERDRARIKRERQKLDLAEKRLWGKLVLL